MIKYVCDRCLKEQLKEMQVYGRWHLCGECQGDYVQLENRLQRYATKMKKEFFNDEQVRTARSTVDRTNPERSG